MFDFGIVRRLAPKQEVRHLFTGGNTHPSLLGKDIENGLQFRLGQSPRQPQGRIGGYKQRQAYGADLYGS